jgi:hypothetical protein
MGKSNKKFCETLAKELPTKTPTEIKEYNSAFWKRFFEIEDPEVRLYAFKEIYQNNWQTTVEAVFEKCKGSFNNLKQNMCTGNLFHLEFTKFVLKKLFFEVSTNPDIVDEISEELTNNELHTKKLKSKGILTRYRPFDKKFLQIINKVLESFAAKKKPTKAEPEVDSDDESEFGGSDLVHNFSEDSNSRASLVDP